MTSSPPHPHPHLLPAPTLLLTELQPGRTARIVHIHGDGSTTTRLHALGLLPEQTIRRQNTAPLGDPVAYDVEGQKISLRFSEAKLVEVLLVEDFKP